MFAAPNLADLFAMIEDFPKPVIAAINGTALGGGLELAMACHYRVAAAAAQLGLPEVKLGILPGAGGTQRLPRLVGAERALNMIVSGTPLAARELADTDLLDSVVDAEVLPAAIALCQHGAGGKLPLKKARDVRINFPNAEAFFDFARGAVRRGRQELSGSGQVHRRGRGGGAQAVRGGHETGAGRIRGTG